MKVKTISVLSAVYIGQFFKLNRAWYKVIKYKKQGVCYTVDVLRKDPPWEDSVG